MDVERRRSNRRTRTEVSGELEKAWEERPEQIREFLEIREDYQALCGEVAYILERGLKAAGVVYAGVVKRAKSLHSFAEKVVRKNYVDPLKQMTDLAGVRAVFLYNQDRATIEAIVANNFSVKEKVDKLEERGDDQFGYGALHYLVQLGRESSGARYDHLKGLVCEIQVRTVLQDAWAIIDHHLSYKHENDVPRHLIRKLNSLSGLFETADDQFDQIKTGRDEYIVNVTEGLRKDSNRDLQLDFDSCAAVIKTRFPKIAFGSPRFTNTVLDNLKQYGYCTIGDLDDLLNRTARARDEIAAVKPPPFAQAQVHRALALVNADFRGDSWTEELNEMFSRYEPLVEESGTRARPSKKL